MAAVTVGGGGLAGCEAAWQLAGRGHHVTLVELRPVQGTPAEWLAVHGIEADPVPAGV